MGKNEGNCPFFAFFFRKLARFCDWEPTSKISQNYPKNLISVDRLFMSLTWCTKKSRKLFQKIETAFFNFLIFEKSKLWKANSRDWEPLSNFLNISWKIPSKTTVNCENRFFPSAAWWKIARLKKNVIGSCHDWQKSNFPAPPYQYIAIMTSQQHLFDTRFWKRKDIVILNRFRKNSIIDQFVPQREQERHTHTWKLGDLKWDDLLKMQLIDIDAAGEGIWN